MYDHPPARHERSVALVHHIPLAPLTVILAVGAWCQRVIEALLQHLPARESAHPAVRGHTVRSVFVHRKLPLAGE